MLDIPPEDQLNYKYIGHHLMYDPIEPVSEELDRTRLALPGNRGVFAHPSFRSGKARSRSGVRTSTFYKTQTTDTSCCGCHKRGSTFDRRGMSYDWSTR